VENKDDLIGTRSISALVSLSKQHDLDSSLVMAFAWPQYQGNEGLKWNDVASFVLGGVTQNEKVKTHASELQQIMDSGHPMIFASPDGHPPHTVVIGDEVYQAVFSDWFHQQTSTGKDFYKHPFRMEDLNCLKGNCSIVVTNKAD
jgi:hypothetical protein